MSSLPERDRDRTLSRPAVLLPATALAVILLAVLLSASCSQEADPPGAVPRSEGPFSVLVESVIDPLEPADPFNKPAAGSRYLAVRISITNHSSQTEVIEPAVDFSLVGRLGSTYRVAVLVSQPEDISAGGETLGMLGPDQRIQGILPFEVPVSDEPAALVFRRRNAAVDVPLRSHPPPSRAP